MNTLTNNGFQFKEGFDGQFLADMYEDLKQVDETFTVIIAQLKEELLSVETPFNAKDKEAVRKIFHKIKPLWGYVGLTKMQDDTQFFETCCRQNENFEDIKADYFIILKKSADALEYLAEESDRIKLFI